MKQLKPNQIQELIDSVRRDAASRLGEGHVADYIPELARIDPKKLGIAVATVKGDLISCGDAEEPFSIQSISKVFTLTLALGKIGDTLWKRVGREPSGTPFDSIIQLEHERGIPRNPLINAGAIVVTDVALAGHQPREAIGQILQFVRFLADGDTVAIDPAMNCCQLARAGLFFANGGRIPFANASVISRMRARRINALMLMCGKYDASGDFAFRVGLPSKSGVGGGIIAIVPGLASIVVSSPALNAQGNSLIGTRVLERIAATANWSVFERVAREEIGLPFKGWRLLSLSR